MRQLLFSALLLSSSVTLAQSSQPSAQEKFEEAKTFYNIGEYDNALAKFKEAYVISREPELLLNIAQCYRFLGKNQEAVRTLKTYLQEAPDSPYAPEAEKLIQELSSTSAPTSSAATTTTSAPKPFFEPPPSEAERKLAKAEALLTTSSLGLFTGLTGAAFLERNESFNRTALYITSSTIGAAGGLGLGFLYTDRLHHNNLRPREIHPLPVGLLLGVGEGITGSRFLGIDDIGPQATLSATFATSVAGLAGGVIATNLYDPTPGDSLLMLSGGAWGAFFGASLVGSAQLDIELLNDFTVSALYNGGILSTGLWTWFADVKRERILRIDALGLAGAASGLTIGGLIEKTASDSADLPIQGASIGGLIGGITGLTAGTLLTRKWVAERPKLKLVPQLVGVLPSVQGDATTIQFIFIQN